MSVASFLGLTRPPSGVRPGRRVQAGSTLLGPGGVQGVSPDTLRGLLDLAGYPRELADTSYVTRFDALKVPALYNGVKIMCGIAAQLPLTADPDGESQSFLDELDPTVPRGWTIARTIDSLIFHGTAYWRVLTRTARGFPRTCRWVDPSTVTVDPSTGAVSIAGEPVDPQDVKRFDGVTDGILTAGVEAITAALANVRQARRYASNPMPLFVLTDPDGVEPLEAPDAVAYLDALRTAVTTRGAAYLGGLKLNPLGWTASEIQLVEARQNDAVEMARLLAIPTRYIAAPEQGSSLTYANLGEVRRDLLEVGGLANYCGPIEQRLSMPDVTPRGTTVRFDADSFFLRVTPDTPSVDTPADTPSEAPPAFPAAAHRLGIA